MNTPPAIRWFERSFLASLALGLAGLVMLWPQLVEATAATPGLERLGQGAIQAVVAGAGLVPTLVGLLLWFLIVHRRSGVARWITVLALAYAIFSTASGLMADSLPLQAATLCAVLSLLFDVVALVMLFMPDARAWVTHPGPEVSS